MKNKKIRQMFAMTLTGVMLCTLPVCAAEPAENTETAETAEMQSPDSAKTETSEKTEEPAKQDEETNELVQEYTGWIKENKARAVTGTYSSELKKFPADYQELLATLHKAHPKWVFIAKNTGQDWNEVVAKESISGGKSSTNNSLLPKTAGSLLLSKKSTDYNASTGVYIGKDGPNWVSASRPAVAYYADPRNFLTDRYIFMFEALNYNSKYHTLTGVENILKGTDLYKKKISYLDKKGKTFNLKRTYGETILAAGANAGVSPLFLTSKIRQETGAKLTNGSISGKYFYGGKSYRGYYNYYNIGAVPGGATGSAVANGLIFAKGGSSGKNTSYTRPWMSPVSSITGGAQWIAEKFIKRGQNTIYYERFNTIVKPYYSHQYMQNLTGAAAEANSTYNTYNNMNIVNDAYVFYIPVYKNMPSQGATVTISKSVKSGIVTTNVTLRKGVSSSTSSLGTIPKGKKVTVSGGKYTDKSLAVSTQEANPYWMKVTYAGKTGYVSSRYLQMNTNTKIVAGNTKQLSAKSSKAGKIYYETSNPAVATVNDSGKVTGKKAGKCMIYAVTSSGKAVDVIGIEVTKKSSSSNDKPAPKPDPKPAQTKTYTTYQTTTNVNYRTGAGTKYATKGTLKKGQKISIENGYSKKVNGYTWYRFKMNGKKYYAASKYLKKVTVAKKTYTKYVTTTSVNYRTGAGTKYATKGTLKKGQKINVKIGYSKKADGYTWYRFKMNSKNYYIASKYLKKA